MLIGDTICGAARRRPDEIAWRFHGRSWSWEDANQRVNRAANALLGLGFQFQDRIGLLTTNSAQLAEMNFALAKAGLVAVPLNTRLAPAEIDFIMGEVDAAGFVVSGDLLDRYQATSFDRAGFRAVIGLGAGHGQTLDYEDFIAAGSTDEPALSFDDNALRVIKFTSGTTGTPKGCMGTHRECLFNFMSAALVEPVAEDEMCGLAVSMNAGLGSYLLSQYAYLGCPTVILDTVDPGRILDAIEAERITRMMLIPPMVASMVEIQAAHPRDVSSLRVISCTGAPMTVSLARRAIEVLGCDFYQCYGATESGGRVTTLGPDEHRRFIAGKAGPADAWGRDVLACGRELPGFHIRLVDESGDEVAPGEVGELVVRGDSVFKGYWNRPDLNAEVLRDGFWSSGDLFRRDDDGYLTLVDRKKDMIVSGGYNIYSVEVEAVLEEHPGISEVAVIGMAHPRWGESVCAFIVPTADTARPDEAELVTLCKQRLAAYKAPKAFVFLDAMPRTTSGKIRKVELREGYRPGSD